MTSATATPARGIRGHAEGYGLIFSQYVFGDLPYLGSLQLPAAGG